MSDKIKKSSLSRRAGIFIVIAGIFLPGSLLFQLIFTGLSWNINRAAAVTGIAFTLFQCGLLLGGVVLCASLNIYNRKTPIFIVLFVFIGGYVFSIIGITVVSFILIGMRAMLLSISGIKTLILIPPVILIICGFKKYIRRESTETTTTEPQPQCQQKEAFLGIIACVLGILSLALSCIPYIGTVGIVPLICGVIAIRQRDKYGILGLVLGMISILISVFIMLTRIL